jgi:protein gp37
MSTTIEWTDRCDNPMTGCSKKSEGCEHCYAISVAGRQMSPQHVGLVKKLQVIDKNGEPVLDGRGRPKMRKQNWTGEIRQVPRVLAKRIPRRKDRRTRVFVNSMSDWFHENLIRTETGRRYVALCFAWMLDQPHVDFQLLTKRPEGLKDWIVWLFAQARDLATVYRRHSSGPTLGPIGDVLVDVMWWSDVPELREVARRWLEGEAPVAIIDSKRQVTWPPKHVFFGATCENQQRADERMPIMEALRVVGGVGRVFVSQEPALGPVDYSRWLDRIDHCRSCGAEHEAQEEDVCPECKQPGTLVSTWGETQAERLRNGQRYENGGPHPGEDGPPIDWLIYGGESGSGARPSHPGWARLARDQAVAAGVPFLFKQWGEWAEVASDDASWTRMVSLSGKVYARGDEMPIGDVASMGFMRKFGKGKTGRELDGRTWDEFPEVKA